MTSQVFIQIETISVERIIANLMRVLSEHGLVAFLEAEVGPYLSRRAGERFANEGDDVVGTWAPLRPATQAIRAESPYAIGPDHPINRRSGELENWVVQGGWNAYPEGYMATLEYPGSLPTGDLLDKVKTAQSGDVATNTVARPVLGLNENDMLWFIAAMTANVEASMVL